MVNSQNPSPSSGSPSPDLRPHLGPGVAFQGSETIYAGPAVHRAMAGQYLKWVLVCVFGGFAGYYLRKFDVAAAVPLWPLAFVGLPGLMWALLVHATTRYKITLRRIELEHGVLSKTVDSLELWRVLDVRYSQSVLDRLVGVARIQVTSTDQSSPVLTLRGLPNARGLFEQMRDAVQVARHHNRPMEVVGDHAAIQH